jgi:hypothetical protein
MNVNVNQFLYKNSKFIAFALLVLAGFCTNAWLQREQLKKLDIIKAESERKLRIGIAFRQAGIAAAKLQQQEAKNLQSLQEDALAPHELSADAELTQAKLWQSLPKNKRAIMQTETINAGLAAANKEPPMP